MKTLAFVGFFLAASCTTTKEDRARKAPAPIPAAAAVAQEVTITSTSPEAVRAFREGRSLLENARSAEAAEHFRRAVALDPRFALGHAFAAMTSPGPDRQKHFAEAAAHLGGLPEPERLTVEIAIASGKGESARARALRAKLASLVPGDWRVQLQLAGEAMGQGKWDEVLRAAERAADLNPTAGVPYNLVGYAYAHLGKIDDAVAALRKYASLKPSEPNPHDSMGEILLMAGRHEEADAAFRKAGELGPKFWLPWEGAALARMLLGDYAGARERLARAREVATRERDKLWIDIQVAKSYQAEGKTAKALRGLEAMEREASARKVGVRWVWAPIHKAFVLGDAGRFEDALRQVDAAFEHNREQPMSKSQVKDLEIRGNLARLWVFSRLKRGAEAEKALARVEAAVEKDLANRFYKSTAHFARGLAALAKGDARGAVGELEQCIEEYFACRGELARAQGVAGDAAAAAATRAQVEKRVQRHIDYVLTRVRLARN